MPYLLGSIGVIAWVMLALDGSDFTLPALCSVGTPWAVPLSTTFSFAMLFNSPEKLASGWALMLAAMMPPIVVAPLRHVRDRSFATRRARAMLLFVGFVLTTGRHTVTRTLATVRYLSRGHFGNYHRFFSRARWSLRKLAKANAATVLDFLDLESAPTLLRPPALSGPSLTGPSGPVLGQ